MKKLFTTLMVLAAALTASAQNFIVTGVQNKDGEPVEIANGDVLNIAPEKGSTTRPGGPYFTWNPSLNVKVVTPTTSMLNLSTLTVTVSASVDNMVQFCAFDKMCKSVGTEAVSKSGECAKGASQALEIEILNKEMPAEGVDIKVTVTDSKETVEFTVHCMTTDEAGISAPEASAENTIAISGRTVRYHLAETANFTLYNISGRAVVSRRIGGSGTLNLESFPAGVYVYRCGTATGKLLLR